MVYLIYHGDLNMKNFHSVFLQTPIKILACELYDMLSVEYHSNNKPNP